MKTSKKKKPAKKIDLKLVLLIIVAVIVVCGVVAQILFNQFVWKELQRHTTFNSRQLMVNAMEELVNQKSVVGDDGKITEARLHIPQDKYTKVVYSHEEAFENLPEAVHFTTRGLAAEGFGYLYADNMEGLFAGVPKAQACTRGIALYINPSTEIDTTGTKKVVEKQLADGRQIQMFREVECDSTQLDDLEKMISQVQSY